MDWDTDSGKIGILFVRFDVINKCHWKSIKVLHEICFCTLSHKFGSIIHSISLRLLENNLKGNLHLTIKQTLLGWDYLFQCDGYLISGIFALGMSREYIYIYTIYIYIYIKITISVVFWKFEPIWTGHRIHCGLMTPYSGIYLGQH